ncbi:MAG: hypothetical protein WC389_09175 [Lutibacter sp.]|jgi:hypothetical protein
MNYERDIRIDEQALDIEWLDQAELAIKYGQYWNACKEELTRADEKVKLITAQLVLKINKDPEKYLGKDIKPTDAKIDAAVKSHPELIKAKEEWITALSKVNEAEIVKNEICFTRKAALENLVVLYGQNYFAGPNMKRNIKEEREKRMKEANTRVRLVRKN